MNYHLRCIACGYEFDESSFANECPRCAGLIDAIIDNVDKAAPDTRYDTIHRFHPFLPVRNPESLARFERARATPIVNATTLAQSLGVRTLLLKDETTMATGTMKDREALLTINRLIINNEKGLVLGSSGNAGIAICYYASQVRGPKLHLFLPSSSRTRMAGDIQRWTDPAYVSVTYIDGSTDEAEDEGRLFARKSGLPYGTGFQNYARREGIKTLCLEYLFDQQQRVDWYVQGVAGALAVYAFYKAHAELNLPCPKLGCVQPAACSPMVNAYEAGSSVLDDRFIPSSPVTVPEAPVLKSRRPTAAYPLIKQIVDSTKGAFARVDADEIKAGLHLYYAEPYFVEKYKKTGLRVGLEAATAMAGVRKLLNLGRIKPDERILLNVSGAARPGDIPDTWWPPTAVVR